MIGYGYWGQILSKYFIKDNGFEIKYIATRNPEKIRSAAPEGADVTRPENIYSDPTLNCVIVASPIDSHFQIVLNLLKNGKHVFCEKPLALKSAEAHILAEEARKKNLCLFTDYTLAFSPGICKVIELAKSGTIGAITAADFNFRQLGHFKHNVYADVGCHVLSVLDKLIPIEKLNFHKNDLVTRNGLTETGIILFNSLSPHHDLRGSAFLSFNYPNKERKISLYGDKGTIIFNITGEHTVSVILYERKTNLPAGIQNVNTAHFDFDETNTLLEPVKAFHRCLERLRPDNLASSIRITEALEKFL